jgi:hypothetical protein
VLRELHFGSILLGVALVVVLAAAASGAVVASSRKNGADRESIVGRLERIWLVASLAVVVGLTLQPGPGGFDSPLPSILNPLSRLHWGDALANTILYTARWFLCGCRLEVEATTSRVGHGSRILGSTGDRDGAVRAADQSFGPIPRRGVQYPRGVHRRPGWKPCRASSPQAEAARIRKIARRVTPRWGLCRASAPGV